MNDHTLCNDNPFTASSVYEKCIHRQQTGKNVWTILMSISSPLSIGMDNNSKPVQPQREEIPFSASCLSHSLPHVPWHVVSSAWERSLRAQGTSKLWMPSPCSYTDTLKFKVSIELHSKRWVKKNSTWPYFSTITMTKYFYVSLEYILHVKEYTHWKHDSMSFSKLVRLCSHHHHPVKEHFHYPKNDLVPSYKQSLYLSTTLLLLMLSHFSRVQLCATPETAAHQAPPSLGFSRQEHWSGLPFPSPMHESEKWKGSRSVMSDSLWPHELQPSRLLHPWDFPGKSTGVGCHCLLWL